MRPRFLICVLILVAAILALIFWLRPVQHATAPTLIQETQHTNSKAGSVNVVPHNISHTPLLVTASTSQKLPAINPRSPEGFRHRIESSNVPIDFYGQFIDQDSNAISGVNIKISIRHWTMPDPMIMQAGSKEIYLEQTSDADGRFEFHNETGDAIYVESVKKNGYELEPRGRNYGTTAGSYDNPVIFKMWSANIHEQLITGDKSFDIVPDGKPYFINLTDDTISKSGEGDLKVWVLYTNQPVRGQLYNWSAGIDVINGGLLEEGLGSAMYEAPTDGYMPSFQLSGQIKGGQRGDIGERQFYLKLKNGKEYGQMSIDLYAPFNNQTPGLIRLSYAINPSGSRVLH